MNGIRNGDLPPSLVVCSLRDILVEKEDPLSYEKRVVDILNSSFHALLIHADPSLITLGQTFFSTDRITIPMQYTGFVTPHPAPGAGALLRKSLGLEMDDILIVASAGGGKVGFRLLESVIRALGCMEAGKILHACIFTGPFMNNDEYDRLVSIAGHRIRVRRFTDDFLSYLAAADLSVSMGGYNTCMNILSARVSALIWPFSQNREQRIRAKKLAGLGALGIVDDDELDAPRLAAVMEKAMSKRPNPGKTIDLEGAANTAQWLASRIRNRENL